MPKNLMAGVKKQQQSLRNRLEIRTAERDRLKALNLELVGALNHCINVLAEYERKPGDDLRGFMLGALDKATAALAKARKEDEK